MSKLQARINPEKHPLTAEWWSGIPKGLRSQLLCDLLEESLSERLTTQAPVYPVYDLTPEQVLAEVDAAIKRYSEEIMGTIAHEIAVQLRNTSSPLEIQVRHYDEFATKVDELKGLLGDVEEW